MNQKILVVDDDEDVAETIERSLRSGGYEVLVAYRGADGLHLARQERPDLVVLDIMMPGMTGVEVCRHMRANPELAQIPVLFLTAKAEIEDKIDGFRAGADDYLTKPFDHRELDLRVKALLRRANPEDLEEERDYIEVGPLTLNCRTFEISTSTTVQLLTPVEFDLMVFLMTHPGRVFSADELLQQVWHYPPGVGMPDLVRVHIKNIREKVEPDPREPIFLRTILRRGYLIHVDDPL